jgi:hypothetical protein
VAPGRCGAKRPGLRCAASHQVSTAQHAQQQQQWLLGGWVPTCVGARQLEVRSLAAGGTGVGIGWVGLGDRAVRGGRGVEGALLCA